MKTVLAGYLWFGGWGVVIANREVAYHRVCCRQEAPVAVRQIQAESWTPSLEDLVEQFDSDFCVHTLGVGSPSPGERVRAWPYVTHKGIGAFESQYEPLWSTSERHRSRRSRRSRSSSNERSRSSSNERSRSSSRERTDMKCATVEVVFDNNNGGLCPLDVFTPKFIADTSVKDPKVRIGTGKGSWNGKSIVDYVDDEHHLKIEELTSFNNGAAGWTMTLEACQLTISRPMIESAVKELGTSLDPKAVVRFLEFATNSRAQNCPYLRKEIGNMSLMKLLRLDFDASLKSLCEKMGQEDIEVCLKAVPIEYLTPSFERQNGGSADPSRSRVGTRRSSGQDPDDDVGQRRVSFRLNLIYTHIHTLHMQSTMPPIVLSGKNVNLVVLRDEHIQQRLVSLSAPKAADCRICNFQEIGPRFLDYVLMKAFLAVSGTSYGELHNRAMQKRLSTRTRKHWMLAACASNLTIKTEVPAKIRTSFHFLHANYSFELEGRSRVEFIESATLAGIDTEGLGPSPTCAVLAGDDDLDHSPKYADRKYEVLVAYFTRDKDGKDKVFRSVTGTAAPWNFFESRSMQQAMFGGNRALPRKMFKDAAERIRKKKKSPPASFHYSAAGSKKSQKAPLSLDMGVGAALGCCGKVLEAL